MDVGRGLERIMKLAVSVKATLRTLKTFFKHKMMSKMFPLVIFQESFNLRLSGVKKSSIRCDQGAGLHQLYQLPFNNLLHQLLQYT